MNGAGPEAFPALAKEIHAAGHEVASENWDHEYVWRQTDDVQRAELERSVGVTGASSARDRTGVCSRVLSIDRMRRSASRSQIGGAS